MCINNIFVYTRKYACGAATLGWLVARGQRGAAWDALGRVDWDRGGSAGTTSCGGACASAWTSESSTPGSGRRTRAASPGTERRRSSGTTRSRRAGAPARAPAPRRRTTPGCAGTRTAPAPGSSRALHIAAAARTHCSTHNYLRLNCFSPLLDRVWTRLNWDWAGPGAVVIFKWTHLASRTRPATDNQRPAPASPTS